jgi:hypothetical protein
LRHAGITKSGKLDDEDAVIVVHSFKFSLCDFPNHRRQTAQRGVEHKQAVFLSSPASVKNIPK